jgi:hypothetical protein
MALAAGRGRSYIPPHAMHGLPSWLEKYGALPRVVLLFAAGQFLINLIHSAQFLLLNLFLKQGGLDDPAIAALGSKRFIATFLLAIPAGLWLRGRPLRRPLWLGAALFPAAALGGLEAARVGAYRLAGGCFLLMGLAGLILNVASLPMMLRLSPKEGKSEALSLLFATWAAAAICGGALSGLLQWMGRLDFGPVHLVLDTHATLFLLTLAGFGAPFFFARLPNAMGPGQEGGPADRPRLNRSDLGLLTRALVPSICIAVGAGLSIQFMNLFFSHVHGMGPAAYSWYGTISSVLVLIAGLLVPEVRRRVGWRGAILGVQGIAVVLLATLGFTEWWRAAAWAGPLAVVLFILRQPLMSMAGPATSELTMAYVGSRNHELISACNGAIWSGSWWLAAVIFQHLRSAGIDYWLIFTTTAVFYAFGTFSYLGIIRATEATAQTDA